MLESLFTPKEPAAPLDLTPWKHAWPIAVHLELERARTGQGLAAAWLVGSAGAVGHGRVAECAALANQREVSDEVFGWLVGITAFDDVQQRLLVMLRKPSHRDPAICHAIDAICAGIAGGRIAPARLWTTMESLVDRRGAGASLRPAIAKALPAGLLSKQAVARGVALRFAHRLGAPAREAIEAARARASASDAATLQSALAALAGGAGSERSRDDDAVLLGKLLANWRATFDPALEKPIAQLGAALARDRGPIVVRSKAELEGAWLAIAATRDPLEVDRLLDAPWPAKWKLAATRVEALRAFDPDPRISRRVLAIARRYDTQTALPLYRAVADLAARAPSRSLLPELDALQAELDRMNADRYIWESLPDIFRSLYETIEALTPGVGDAALLAEAAQHEDTTVDLEALYAEHAANPGDLAARAVLADALQLAGDPRGEFIALQLAGADDPRAAKRAEALLAEHGDAWTGPLPGVRRATRRFERGFLVAAETGARDVLIARSLERPEWRTVEELAVIARGPREIGELVARMPLLRRLAADAGTLLGLAARGVALRGIDTVYASGDFVPDRALFPDLATFGIELSSDPPAARVHQILAQTRELELGSLVHLGAYHPIVATALALRHSGPAEQRFVLGQHRGGFDVHATWVLRALRDEPDTIDITCCDGVLLGTVTAVFELLPSVGVKRVVLDAPAHHRSYFESLRLEVI